VFTASCARASHHTAVPRDDSLGPNSTGCGGTGAQIIYELQIASQTLSSLRLRFVLDQTM
jgi:hypothetical protein